MKEVSKRDSAIIVRLTKGEKALIAEKAKTSYLKVTDYVRIKLLDEADLRAVIQNNEIPLTNLSKTRFACDHDKEQMRAVFRMYMYTRELIKLAHGDEVYKKVNDLAKLQLKEWGYE